jgi:hypothetical protein
MKNGDILPCGGKIMFIASTGYYFTPKNGGGRQWISTQAQAVCPPIDYIALNAEREAEERERNRERTPIEEAAFVAKHNAWLAARLAQPDDIARAKILGERVPAENRAEWIEALRERTSREDLLLSSVEMKRRGAARVLGLDSDRVAEFHAETGLFGHLPELDSMAVAGLQFAGAQPDPGRPEPAGASVFQCRYQKLAHFHQHRTAVQSSSRLS